MVKKLNKAQAAAEREGRRSRRERRRAQSREELLDAAETVLHRDGVANVTVDAVAQEVDLSKTALYHYFESKDALLFELVFRHLSAEAQTVHDAVAATEDGASALAAMIRAVIGYHAPHIGTFQLCYLQGQVAGPAFMSLNAAMIERLRPLNELLYAGTEARLKEAKKRGELRAGVNPRRLAFLAHMAAVGLLTMKGMVEGADDPLVHKDDDLVKELGRAFASAAIAD